MVEVLRLRECFRFAEAFSPLRMTECESSLADDLLFQGDGAGAAGRALDAIAELADVNLQLADGAAEGVAVHAQFAGGAALVAFVLLRERSG